MSRSWKENKEKKKNLACVVVLIFTFRRLSESLFVSNKPTARTITSTAEAYACIRSTIYQVLRASKTIQEEKRNAANSCHMQHTKEKYMLGDNLQSSILTCKLFLYTLQALVVL